MKTKSAFQDKIKKYEIQVIDFTGSINMYNFDNINRKINRKKNNLYPFGLAYYICDVIMISE